MPFFGAFNPATDSIYLYADVDDEGAMFLGVSAIQSDGSFSFTINPADTVGLGQMNYFQVLANVGGNTSDFSEPLPIDLNVTPVATAATSVSKTGFTANWTNTGAASYDLEISTSSDFSAGVTPQTGIADTFYIATGMTANTVYYYRVRNTGSTVNSNTKVTSTILPPGSGNGLTFDGTNYVEIKNQPEINALTNTYTIEAWINPTQWTGTSDFENGIVGNEGAADGFTLRGGGNQRISFAIYDKTNSVWANSLSSTIKVNTGIWTHVAVSVVNNEASLYINGVFDKKVTYASDIYYNSAKRSLWIGGTYDWTGVSDGVPDRLFKGQIDEVRIWNVARSEADIKEAMCHKLKGDEAGLINYFRLDEGIGTITENKAKGSKEDGVLKNTPKIGLSGAPIGDVSAYSYSSGVGALSTTLTDTDEFIANYTATAAKQGVQVYKVNEAPNDVTKSAELTALETTSYFGVFPIGGSSYNVKYNYATNTNLSSHADEPTMVFATRPDNASNPWVGLGKSVLNTSADTLSTKNQLVRAEYIAGFANKGEALDFDGVNDYISVPDGMIDLSKKSFTIEFWARRKSITDGDYIIGQGTSSMANSGLHIGFQYNTPQTFRFGFFGQDLDYSGIEVTDITNWQHWAVVYDATSKTQKIFNNGSLVASRVSASDYLGTGEFFIGNTAWPSNFFNGQLDEIRVWSRALCEAEIAANMNADVLTNKTNLIVQYSFNQGFDGANNSTINYLVDSVNVANDGTLVGFDLNGTNSNWVAPGAITSGTVATTVICPAKAPSTVCAQQSNGEVTVSWDAVAEATLGYEVIWGTDSTSLPLGGQIEAGITATISGLSNNTQYYFAVVSVGGDTSSFVAAVPVLEAGKALQFDGTKQAIDFGDVTFMDGLSEMSYEFWVNPQSIPSTGIRTIIAKGINPSTIASYITNTGDLVLEAQVGLTKEFITIKSTDFKIGEWTHVALTWSSSGSDGYLRAYKDGLEYDSYPADPGTISSNNSSLMIGTSSYTEEQNFDGFVDEVRIWNRALSANEINQNKDSNKPTDLNGLLAWYHLDETQGNITYDAFCNGNHGTWINSPKVVDSKAMQPFAPDTLVATTGRDQDSILVTFSPNKATDVEFIKVYRSSTASIDTSDISQLLTTISYSSVDTFFVDKSFPIGVADTFWYQVVGVDFAGQVGFLSLIDSAVIKEVCSNPLLVTKVTDNNSCGTLRAAIDYANSTLGQDTIKFNITGGTLPYIINLQSALPALTDAAGTVIDGFSQPGASANTVLPFNATTATPLDAVYGIVLGNGANIPVGLTLTSDYNVVKGLVLQDFGDGTATSNDIAINIIGDNNQVLGCYIGVDETGVTNGTKTNIGIKLTGSTCAIGDGTASGVNLISGLNEVAGIDKGCGIEVNSVNATSNKIVGNIIGLQKDGSTLVAGAKSYYGIYLYNSPSNNTIGGTAVGEGNVISGNVFAGIYLTSILENSIQGNIIGPQADGETSVVNNTQTRGVYLYNAKNHVLGGGAVGAKNIISGNSSVGIDLEGANCSDNVIEGNYIGIDITGTKILTGSPQGKGLAIADPAQNNTIKGNVISGNVSEGIYSRSTVENTIIGNIIGLQADGETYLVGSVQIRGMSLNGTKNHIIGGDALAERNIISGNVFDGVAIRNSPSSGNIVKGNYIGPDKNGNAVASSSQKRGVFFENNTANNTVGGSAVGESNLIAFNTENGIFASGSGSLSNKFSSNSIFSNTLKGISINYGSNQANGGKVVPVITSATTTTISGTGITGDTVEVFVNPAPHSSKVQGKTYVKSELVVDGKWSITGTFALGDSITATATDATNGTSEFSVAVLVQEPLLPAPATVCAKPIGKTVEVSWAEVVGATSYTVSYGIDTTGTLFTKVVNVPEVSTIISTDLELDQINYFSVSANGGEPSMFKAAVPVVEAGKALKFTATSKVVLKPLIQEKIQYSITAWIKLDPLGVDSNRLIYSEGNPEILYYFSVSNGNLLNLSVWNGEPWVSVSNTKVLPFNEWVFVAASFNNGSVDLTVNDYSETHTSMVVRPDAKQNIAAFGLGNNKNYPFIGEIDEITIWDKALTAAELSSMRDTPISGSETGLAGLWHFDEPSGNIAYDASCHGNNGVWQGSPVSVESKAMHPYQDTITAVANGAQVDITWDPNVATDVDTIAVYRKEGAAGVWKLISSGLNTNSFSDLSPVNDSLFYYIVTVDKNGQVGIASLEDTVVFCGDPLVVTKATDANTCGTLRYAINYANATSGADEIKFNISGGTLPYTINLQSALPALTDTAGTVIDGFSQPGASANTVPPFNATTATPLDAVYGVVLGNGDNIPVGLTLTSDNNVVKGLVLQDFGDGAVSNNDIAINIAGNNNQVLACIIGLDANGLIAGTKTATGIEISGNNNIIGDGTVAGANLISGLNGQYSCIEIVGGATAGNTINGNMIGLLKDGVTKTTGTISSYGIHLVAGANIVSGNVISGRYYGISIGGSTATANQIKGNIIGPQADGKTYLLSNSQIIGIYLSNSHNHIIGGNTPSERNVISGNKNYGVYIENSNSNEIKGNYVGLNKDGNAVIANSSQGIGIYLAGTSEANIVGEGNVVSGNTSEGITLNSSAANGNTIIGNIVGPQANGTTYLASSTQNRGVLLSGSPNNKVGGTTVGEGNVISGNNSENVYVSGATSTGNKIIGNFIGTDKTGLSKLLSSNQAIGVHINEGASNNKIGGTALGESNIIAFNSNGINATALNTVNNKFSSNSIFSNTSKGININYGSVEANGGKVVPVITSATTTTISGTGITGDTVEVFVNPAPHSSKVQGKTYVKSELVVDGKWSITGTFALGDSITATATDATNGTSEFSVAVLVQEPLLPAPATVCAKPIGKTVEVSWAEVVGATSYTVSYGIDTTGTLITKVINAPAVSTIISTDLVLDQINYFSVSANGGDTSAWTGAVLVVESGRAISGFSENDYIQISGLLINDFPAYTIEAWVKPNSLTGYQTIFEFANDSPFFGLEDGVPTMYTKVSSIDPVLLNEWVHLAVTYDTLSGDAKIYVNGLLTNVQTNGVGSFKVTDFTSGIGYHNDDNAFDGEIDEVRIWSVARSVDQINNNKDVPLLGTETDLVGLWHFDEPSGAIAYDASCSGYNGVYMNAPTSVISKAMHPYKPRDLTVVKVCGEDSIQISWSENIATDIDKYLVYRGEIEGFDTAGLLPIVVGDANNDSFVDTAVKDGKSFVVGTTYFYKVVGVDAAGQIGVISDFDSVTFEKADTSIDALSQEFCDGESTILFREQLSSRVDSIQWYEESDGFTQLVDTLSNGDSLSVSETGNYFFKAYLNGCFSNSDTLHIEESEKTNTELNFTSDTTVCHNALIRFALDEDNDTIAWYSVNDIAASLGSDVSFTFNGSTEGIDSIYAVVGLGSCADTTEKVRIETLAPLDTILSYSDRLINGTDTLVAAAILQANETVSWYKIGVQDTLMTSETYFEVITPGQYYFTRTNGICSVNSDTVTMSLDEDCDSVLEFATLEYNLCAGKSVDLTPSQDLTNYSYSWYNSQGDNLGTDVSAIDLEENYFIIGSLITDANCNLKSDTIVVDIEDAIDSSLVQLGTSLTVTGTDTIFTAVNDGLQIEWFKNDVQEPTFDDLYEITVTEIGDYYFIKTDGLCNAQSRTVTVNFKDACDFDITALPTHETYCGMKDGIISISGLDDAKTYDLFYNDTLREIAVQSVNGNYDYVGLSSGDYTKIRLQDVNGICKSNDIDIKIEGGSFDVISVSTLAPLSCDAEGVLIINGLVSGEEYLVHVSGQLDQTQTAVNGIIEIALSVGEYEEVSVEKNACVSNVVSAKIDSSAALIISEVAKVDLTKCGQTNGDGKMTITGMFASTGNIFELDGEIVTPQLSGSEAVFASLAEGHHTIQYLEGTCKSNILDFEITAPTEIIIDTILKVDPTGCGLSTGAVTIKLANSIADQSFAISYDGEYQFDNTSLNSSLSIPLMTAGTYDISLISNETNCVSANSKKVSLIDGNAPKIILTESKSGNCGDGSGSLSFTGLTAPSYTLTYKHDLVAETKTISGVSAYTLEDLTPASYSDFVFEGSEGCFSVIDTTIQITSSINGNDLTATVSVVDSTICDNNSFVKLDVVSNSSSIKCYQWYLDGVPLSGDTTNPSVNAFVDGLYSVKVDDGNCKVTAKGVNVTVSTDKFVPVISTENDQLIVTNVANGVNYQWYVEYNSEEYSIVEAKMNSYNPLYNGMYSVSYSNGYCTFKSNPFVFSDRTFSISRLPFETSGNQIWIKEQDELISFSLIPNPASDQIQLEYSSVSTGELIIEVINSSGILVWSSNSMKDEFTFNKNISFDWPTGVYNFRMILNNQIQTSTIVIEEN